MTTLEQVIECCDCGMKRTIKVQDVFQVKRCAKCQRSYRIKLDAQRRKAKRATTGIVVVDGNEVYVTRPNKTSEKFTVESVGDDPHNPDHVAIIEDGADMMVTKGDRAWLPVAIRAVELFKNGGGPLNA